ncbi:MAG: GNAT family N-acetyltransferase [Candidatus Marinimicrobia bacterium]|nr:GNAT family N-acetyltransferase [Candidatus Neomarinimicrobiota bacterium]MCF7828359.1 GNAT family N-acetyltransferase [Candidatus Neomarinimicrobiota bacterium]MCF7881048.1 GNAT family N-acetyltransferase [Candidatus Neomarinimicrobiota bacterium]
MDRNKLTTSIVETQKELQRAMEIREEVFIRGQDVPVDLERDGRGEESTHFLLHLNDSTIGTGRFRPLSDDTVKFERMAVLEPHRNKGYGTRLLDAMIDYARRQGFAEITLNAQIDAVKYYERAGFQEVGQVFMEAGIRHQKMVYSL